MRSAQRLRQARSAVRPRPMAAIAAPEKTETSQVPPFQAWTTGAAIKKREDIKSILLLGAGPIVIGQVLQMCKATLYDARKLIDNMALRRLSSLTIQEHKRAKPSSKSGELSS